jgi:hypothetical protein
MRSDPIVGIRHIHGTAISLVFKYFLQRFRTFHPFLPRNHPHPLRHVQSHRHGSKQPAGCNSTRSKEFTRITVSLSNLLELLGGRHLKPRRGVVTVCIVPPSMEWVRVSRGNSLELQNSRMCPDYLLSCQYGCRIIGTKGGLMIFH